MASVAKRAQLLPIIAGREDRTAVYSRSGEPLWSRAELRERAAEWGGRIAAPNPALVFLLCGNAPDALAALYGAVGAGHAVALLDPAVAPPVLERLKKAFAPDVVIAPADDGATVGYRLDGAAEERPADGPIAGDLAVLLSTSGTTGSQKFVRLSTANLVANADQIASALGMTPDDVGIAHLPLHYSYGLSVVTSHLRLGAAVHLWDDSVTIPEFWESVGRSGGTQFPGVPFHYNFLARGDLAKIVPPSVRTFTQAGGALAPRLQSRMHQSATAVGGRFFVMYGQTEAAPRMTTLPHDALPGKLGSVGPALPGARLSIWNDKGEAAAAGAPGRVIYEGGNVMLGYAESRSDMALGDVMGGRLETGDLGFLDADGYLTLTGRAKRFAKLHGLRLGLDEVEARFAAVAEVAAVERGEKILLFTSAVQEISALIPVVAAEYKIPSASFGVREAPELPRKASGKIDYAALESMT